MAREYGKVLMSAWNDPDFTLDHIYSGPIPHKAKDYALGVVAHNTQHIYAFYGASGEPLYVGRTYDPGVRWFRHKKKARWWHDVESADLWLMVGPDRKTVDADICEVEKWFICELDPIHNIVKARVKCLGSK